MRPLIIACLVACLVILLWIIGRITLALQFFSVTNTANLPTLRPGRFFFTTNLLKPKRFKYLCYRTITPEEGRTIRTHRLCGLPGDTVEIKAGILYVNGKNEDTRLPLTHMYKIDQKDTFGIIYDRQLAYTIPPYSGTIYAPLDVKYVQRFQLPCVRYILPPGVRDEAIYQLYKKNWNRDNFGPLRVPADKLFVLGDNRENTEDSRYMGLIAQSKYVGTILWK
ncbi:MAG TPA: S26 family signal peptidase [Puia sp.]|nr:S26 family signal peptidase [Puia sp.]